MISKKLAKIEYADITLADNGVFELSITFKTKGFGCSIHVNLDKARELFRQVNAYKAQDLVGKSVILHLNMDTQWAFGVLKDFELLDD